MHRTVAYITTPFLQYPLILDLLRAESAEEHRYDYPMWYGGHLVSLNFPYERPRRRCRRSARPTATSTLAPGVGTQRGVGDDDLHVDCRRPFSTRSRRPRHPLRRWCSSNPGDFDPDFNLRTEKGYIIREQGRKNHTFFSSLETHGTTTCRSSSRPT